MPKLMAAYRRTVEPLCRVVGRLTMLLVFVMIFVLMWSTASKVVSLPALWTLDISQFLMVAYFLLGGAYSLQQDGHVRMDLLYGTLKPRKKAWVDVFTVFFMIVFLIVLMIGAVGSTIYSLEYAERGFSAWRPLMWPIKLLMCFGILLMILQSIATLFRDIAILKGWESEGWERDR